MRNEALFKHSTHFLRSSGTHFSKPICSTHWPWVPPSTTTRQSEPIMYARERTDLYRPFVWRTRTVSASSQGLWTAGIICQQTGDSWEDTYTYTHTFRTLVHEWRTLCQNGLSLRRPTYMRRVSGSSKNRCINNRLVSVWYRQRKHRCINRVNDYLHAWFGCCRAAANP